MLTVYGITYDHTTNYGSCLQAYALQTAIEKVCVGGMRCSYFLIPIKTFKEFPVESRFNSLVIKPFMEFHRMQFKGFEKKYMKFADVSTIEELQNLNQTADAFVCGSDVIWNPDFNYGLNAFYLDFAQKYKFSYAASFGKIEISDNCCDKIRENLETFNSISVREKSGTEIIKKCLGKDALVVADPVLLLGKEEWNQVAEHGSEHNSEKYIFVYTTHLNNTIKDFIVKLKEQTGLKTILSTAGPKQALKQGIFQVQKPERWLQQLRDAEFVVTNSFHATVFSILFHKKFFTVVHGDKRKGINIRMNDFLTSVGLENRIFSILPEQIFEGDIDYAEVDKLIDLRRRDSFEFLRVNLETAYKQKIELEAKEIH